MYNEITPGNRKINHVVFPRMFCGNYKSSWKIPVTSVILYKESSSWANRVILLPNKILLTL